jgi:hypothetical protein
VYLLISLKKFSPTEDFSLQDFEALTRPQGTDVKPITTDVLRPTLPLSRRPWPQKSITRSHKILWVYRRPTNGGTVRRGTLVRHENHEPQGKILAQYADINGALQAADKGIQQEI